MCGREAACLLVRRVGMDVYTNLHKDGCNLTVPKGVSGQGQATVPTRPRRVQSESGQRQATVSTRSFHLSLPTARPAMR